MPHLTIHQYPGFKFLLVVAQNACQNTVWCCRGGGIADVMPHIPSGQTSTTVL